MQVSSTSIANGQIQAVHAAKSKGGQDQPLALTVRGIPGEARYLCIVGDDPDALKPAGRVWVHWNVFNVPLQGDTLEIPAGQPPGGEAGTTSSGHRGYEGMAPPDGEHTYRFAVFASREPIKVDTGKAWTIHEFERSYGSQALGKAMTEGRFR